MLLRKYATKWWFVIPHLLTNISALPWETWTWTLEIVFSLTLYTVSRNDTGLACYIFDIHQPILIFLYIKTFWCFFGSYCSVNLHFNALLCVSLLCMQYANIISRLAIWFSRHGIHHDSKDNFLGLCSAETLVRRGWITNHRLIARSQQHLWQK